MSTTLDLSELHSKMGPIFMAGMPGPELDDGTEALIRDYHLGGIILFSRNIIDPVQVATLCRNLQKKAMEYNGRPMFLAVDQEGGRVARLKSPFTQFPGNTAIGKDDSPLEKALEFGHVTAKEMRLVGLNMNLAPVVDVQSEGMDRHLEGRTFGSDRETVARLGKAVVRAIQAGGVMAVAKHFPGLGRAGLDPHRDSLRIDADVREMNEVHLHPFRAVMEEGVSAMMTSHAFYPAYDPGRPATLSPLILTRLLREEMVYRGLVITDDLEMGAVAGKWGVVEGAASAFAAGADILLICEGQDRVKESYHFIRSGLLSGDIPVQRLHESHDRIVQARSAFLRHPVNISLKKVEEYFGLSS